METIPFKSFKVKRVINSEALKSMNLTMVSIDAIDKKEDLTEKTGFICNSSAHWIAIRKINGIWFNLNSLGMRMP